MLAAVLLSVVYLAIPSIADIMIIENFNETSDACIELNKNRQDLSQCCNYPQIHFRRFFQGSCAEECMGSRDICCSIGCIWRAANIVDNENELDKNGIVEELKKSVKHDDKWDQLIEEAVDECIDINMPQQRTHVLCKFPWHVIKVFGCTTRKLFLQCPKMKNSVECKVTKEYVQECM